MPKIPSRYLRWAFDAIAGALIEPPTGVREVGYATGQRPPAQWFNYWFNELGGWLDFLRGPPITNWTRYEFDPEDGDVVGGFDIDTTTPDTAPFARFVIAVKDNTTSVLERVYVSYRGFNYVEQTNFNAAPTGTFTSIQCLGGWWLLAVSDKFYTTPADDGVTASALKASGGNWIAQAIANVRRFAYNDAGLWIGVVGTDPATWIDATDPEAFDAFASTGTVSGEGKDIAWDGTYFVSVTDDGEIWRTTGTGVNFTKSATLASTGDWRLAVSVAEEKILAYKFTGTAAYVSIDHGVTWTAVTFPLSGAATVKQVWYDDGSWYLLSTHYPVLWTSNDLVTWKAAVLPFTQAGMAVGGTGSDVPGYGASGRGLIMLMSNALIYHSHLARDATTGDPVSFNSPVALSDAAYFDGNPLELGVSPDEGQVFAWDVATQQYRLTSIAGVGDPNVFDRTFTFAGGAHDYTADPNWASAAYPDSETDASASGLLGDDGTVPYFYAFSRDSYAAGGLTRTAGGKLRIAYNTAGNAPWVGVTGGPGIAIPLPDARQITIELTVTLGATALAASNRLGIGISRGDAGGAAPDYLAKIYVETQSDTEADETVSIWGHDYAAAGVDSYVASNAFVRHYRIVIDGPSLAVYGGAVGATTATTLIHGRSNALAGGSRRDMELHIGIGVGSTEDGLYAEIDNLHYSGNRAP